ncbi:hypothetical protein [Streptomyces sp. NPDC020298]|uniref:hypothetical protein n=1 Tax=unclassified Streptomyces TaxID=2593676 RepID=UPI0033F6C0D2
MVSPDGEATPASVEPLTVDGALANAVRLLQNAEMQTDHALMARLESLADSWIAIARTIAERG